MNVRVTSYLTRAQALADGRRFDEATAFERVALDEARRAGDPSEEVAAVYAQAGRRALRQDAAAEALDWLERSLAMRDALDLRDRGTTELRTLAGIAAHRAGQADAAVSWFECSLALSDRLFGERSLAAVPTLLALAATQRAQARFDEADAALHRAAAIVEATGDPGGNARGQVNAALSDLYHAWGRPSSKAPLIAAPRAPMHESSEQSAIATAGEPPPATAQPAALEPAAGALEKALAELDALIGLELVKAQVHTLTNFLRVQRMRQRAGQKEAKVSHHLVFTGAPGTGKTTVARLLGRIYHALEILPTPKLVEVSRADLIAGYVGQTAAKVNTVCDSALDGILFIDEAYSLARPGSGEDFGAEAIAELVKRLEDDRARLVVIAAGYKREMQAFLDANSGLRSRFAEQIEFEDYKPPELAAIFRSFAAQNEYKLSQPADKHLERLMEQVHSKRGPEFGNARTARNIFEDAIAAHANRVIASGAGDPALLETIEPADLDVAVEPLVSAAGSP